MVDYFSPKLKFCKYILTVTALSLSLGELSSAQKHMCMQQHSLHVKRPHLPSKACDSDCVLVTGTKPVEWHSKDKQRTETLL